MIGQLKKIVRIGLGQKFFRDWKFGSTGMGKVTTGGDLPMGSRERTPSKFVTQVRKACITRKKNSRDLGIRPQWSNSHRFVIDHIVGQ